jgi:hypothetical protein
MTLLLRLKIRHGSVCILRGIDYRSFVGNQSLVRLQIRDAHQRVKCQRVGLGTGPLPPALPWSPAVELEGDEPGFGDYLEIPHAPVRPEASLRQRRGESFMADIDHTWMRWQSFRIFIIMK